VLMAPIVLPPFSFDCSTLLTRLRYSVFTLDIIVDWTKKWQMKLNTDKCRVMQLGRNNGNNECSMLGQKLQVVNKEKDLGIMISSDLKREEQ